MPTAASRCWWLLCHKRMTSASSTSPSNNQTCQWSSWDLIHMCLYRCWWTRLGDGKAKRSMTYEQVEFRTSGIFFIWLSTWKQDFFQTAVIGDGVTCHVQGRRSCTSTKKLKKKLCASRRISFGCTCKWWHRQWQPLAFASLILLATLCRHASTHPRNS